MNDIMNKLVQSTGNFWSRGYDDKDLVRAKLLADNSSSDEERRAFLETADCLIRSKIPEFHKYGYVPLIISLDLRNNTDKATLYMGHKPDVVLGGQPSSSVYGYGTLFHLNGVVVRSGYVCYPVIPEISDFITGMPFIQSSLYRPEVVYTNGIDFYVERGAIFFKKELDPFNNISSFITRDTSEGGRQLLLWGAEVQRNDNNIIKFMPIYEELVYAFDHPYYKEAMNRIYDLAYAGPEKKYISAAACGIFGIPYCRSDSEMVSDVMPGMVLTDKNVYKWEGPAEPAVVKGATITYGQPITRSVRIYWNVDFNKFSAWNDHNLEQFKIDVPIMSFDRGVIGDIPGVNSIAAGHNRTDILYAGDDLNGNPKLWFHLDISRTSEEAYWNYIWASYENDGKSMVDDFSPYLIADAFPIVGMTVGSLIPAQFYCDNFLKGNTYVIVVDFNGLPEYINRVDGIGALRRAMPAHTIIFCYARLVDSDDELDPTHRDSPTWAHGNRSPADQLLIFEDNIKYKIVRVL